jgi:hypothetical protein
MEHADDVLTYAHLWMCSHTSLQVKTILLLKDGLLRVVA